MLAWCLLFSFVTSAKENSAADGAVPKIAIGPDTTNTLHLALTAEYTLGTNGCSAITYSGEDGLFYVLQDHDEDGYAKIYPLILEIDSHTGAIHGQSLVEADTPSKWRDSEGMSIDPFSGALWISDEAQPPSIAEFGLDGSPTGRTAPVPSIQRTALRDNFSLESLTISPDGLTMWTANEQALKCDGELSVDNKTVSTVVRLMRYTRATALDIWTAAGEWAYICDPCTGTALSQSGLSGLCALPDGSLLALEREVSIISCGRCRIYRITTGALAAATEVSGFPSLTNTTFSAVDKGECLLDFTGQPPSTVLGPYELIVYEGIALGPKLRDGSYAVYLVSDGGVTTTRMSLGIKVNATTVNRICALRLTGLPDDSSDDSATWWSAIKTLLQGLSPFAAR